MFIFNKAINKNIQVGKTIKKHAFDKKHTVKQHATEHTNNLNNIQ